MYTVIGNALGSRPWQFFDLHNDPYQMNNLVDAPEYRDLVARYHRVLRDHIISTGDHYLLSEAFGCESLNDWQPYA